MAGDLPIIGNLQDPMARKQQYSAFMVRAVEDNSDSLLRGFMEHICDEGVAQGSAKALISEFTALLVSASPTRHKTCAEFSVRALERRMHSFEGEIIALRVQLAKLYEAEQEWTLAARTLAGIPFDGTARSLTAKFRLEQYTKIARYLIEDNRPEEAETYHVRASFSLGDCDDPAIRLMHKVSSAMLMDAKRRFEDAARKYLELSLGPGSANTLYGKSEEFQVTDEECMQALDRAITCAILAPAGPRRSRILATLYNDERSRSLPVFPMLECMYMGRLLKSELVDSFRPKLQPHQVAIGPDGSTVLDRAVVEHNLSAAARLYSNIRIQELGALLGVAPDKAESVCRDMAAEGRMVATIDQVLGVVEFETPSTRSELERWDAQIADICTAVDGCSDAILKSYPALSRV